MFSFMMIFSLFFVAGWLGRIGAFPRFSAVAAAEVVGMEPGGGPDGVGGAGEVNRVNSEFHGKVLLGSVSAALAWAPVFAFNAYEDTRAA